MSRKITKRRVDAAKPGETIWDEGLPGFGLRVFASGKRSYVLKYRTGGVQRWFTIGRHGVWTPDAARSEAKRLLALVDMGSDPANERAENRGADTFAEFAERYLAEYSRTYKKPASARSDAAILKRNILPAFGKKRVKDISREDVARLHSSMKNTPYAANRCRALLSHMFKKSEAWGLRPDGTNPTAHVEKYKEKARDRFLSNRELNRLGRVLLFLDRFGYWTYSVAAIRLLVFTGARLSEILTLRWEYVDTQARLLRLPDSKTGEKTVALSAPALSVLATIPRIEGNPYVICGKKDGTHLVNPYKHWYRIRKAALIPNVRIHDLRHSFASTGVGSGLSLPIIGSLLGHSQPQTTQRYAHLANNPRLSAAESIASEIDATMRGEGAQIIRLTRKN
ncbi:tyrosine-type recombinase/integrase [Hyphococcus formosus]|uniref:tyrosine-type recombinase/integrase n=1 Tax=Hyphococcus formosus TaxID=3143534 RepID=UPI00398BA456